MDSLVMVAYTFSITVGLPQGEIVTMSIEGGADGPSERVSIAKLSSAENEAGISDDDVINRPGDGSTMTSSGKSDLEATPVVSEEDDVRVTSLLRSASRSIEAETGEDEISQMTRLQQENTVCFRSTEPENPSTTSLTTPLQVKNPDDETIRWYSAIVEALEKLGVLESDGKWCYSVERISRSSTSPSPSLLTVELLIEAKPAVFSPVPSHSNSALRAMLVVGRRSDVTVTNTITTSGVGCGVDGTSGGEDCAGATSDGNSRSIPRAEAKLTQLGAVKPNRTQVLVISTCSSVIGVFFAVALIIRIRNHLRRTRSLSMRRGAFRNSQAHVTSGPRETSSASGFSLAGAPSGEANRTENIAGKKSSRRWENFHRLDIV